MNPWLAFFLGIVVGEFAMLCIIALFRCSGEDRQQKGVEADVARYMLNQ